MSHRAIGDKAVVVIPHFLFVFSSDLSIAVIAVIVDRVKYMHSPNLHPSPLPHLLLPHRSVSNTYAACACTELMRKSEDRDEEFRT